MQLTPVINLKPIEMRNISIFKSFATHVEDESLEQIFETIKSETYKTKIEAIRSALASGDKIKADKLKKSLPAFTTSGSFLNGRQAELITSYSNHLILDIDHIKSEALEEIKNKAILAPYSLAVFISPSGNGIKIIVKCDATLEQHKEAMLQVSEYYEQALELELDHSGKDVSRLCFFSYDPEIHINFQASTFEIQIKTAEPEKEQPKEKTTDTNQNLQQQFEVCIKFTEKVKRYEEGNRNNFIHLLTTNCNRRGLLEDNVLYFITQTYTDLDQSEIENTVKNVYKNNFAEHGKFSKSANTTNLQSEEDNTPTVDFLSVTPTIPQALYDTLPKLLKETSEAFDYDLRKRDVYLTSAIVVLSGCLPKVSGIYSQELVFPHLFSFVVAPPASGKGVLKNAKSVGDKIHERLIKQSTEALEQYEKDKIHYEFLKKTYKGEGELPKKPIKPPYKLLFIPGDCSQARILELLNENDGKGIICETEADVVSGANKQDWGNYSPILRCAFHHEKVSVSRKTDNQLTEIPTPQIAVALAGTPNQVGKLIASAEDGLFSRFLFYAFKSEIQWQSPAPNPDKKTLNELFEDTSNAILEAHYFLADYKTQVTLSASQWNKLNKSFAGKLNSVALFTSEDAVSIVFRLGLIVFRFCMIFTALRKFENGEIEENIECEDDDFNNALTLSDIYLQHSLLIYNNLSDKDKKPDYEIPDNKKRFHQALPSTIFQRKEAVEIGKQFEMSARSVDSFLKTSTGNLLACVKTGYYQKKN